MYKHKKCPYCKKRFGLFRFRHYCEECRKMYCSNCIIEYDEYKWYSGEKPTDKYKNDYICKICNEVVLKISPFHRNYINAIKNIESIVTFPKTYKGKISLSKNSDIIEIESEYFEDRNDSLYQLKVTALVRGYNILFDIEYSKKTKDHNTGGGGVYYYSVWSAYGKAGIK